MTPTDTPEVRLRECHDCLSYTRTTYSRCEACRHKRLRPDRKRRRAISRALFPRVLREAVLRELRKGRLFGEVCLSLRIAPTQLHSFARINPWFRSELDEALMQGRNPALRHGSESAYRLHRCRCPECRRGKAARRSSAAAVSSPPKT